MNVYSFAKMVWPFQGDTVYVADYPGCCPGLASLAPSGRNAWQPPRSTRQRPERRAGQTLLELIGATTIIAVALVPALRVMCDATRAGRQTEASNLMATLAVGRLEEFLLRSAGEWGGIPQGNPWGTTVDVGDYAAEGYPNLKFTVVRSDAAPQGIAARLLSITATVWDDMDNDNAWDAGEPRSVFASKLARNVAYTNEAAGT